jgi:diguanylate cyclase (GGDEF)-like protein
MARLSERLTSPRLLTRVTVVGMSVAVLALGGLAAWSALGTTRDAAALAGTGAQINGQLGAVQSLYVIRTEAAKLEDEYTDDGVARMRAAVQAIPADLARMAVGDSTETARVARQAMPVAAQLGPVIEQWIADPRGDVRYKGEDDDDASEEVMEEVINELDSLLSDSEADPAQLLTGKLDKVTDAGQAISRATGVLVPLGLGGVVVCGLLLRVYRRRSEATMQLALDATAREARTDQLTGLPNRRAVLEELDRRASAGETFTFALADLNGFKHYNDTFGHPAGDALLRRLGHKLGIAWDGYGYVARLGGDEFCVITDDLAPERLQAVLHDALSDQGEGFNISAVSGLAEVPTEAADPNAALSLADTRLYAAKAVFYAANRHLPGRAKHASDGASSMDPAMTHPAMTKLINNSHVGLGNEIEHTTTLTLRCAETLELPPDQIAIIERAAELHDIGKAALPVAILAKREALTDDEQRFIRRYTAIGERLVNNVDDLEPVAAIVRSSQERWDGAGYPDQLVGEQIPIGSRIIAVTAAFSAMITDRPHAAARSVDDALIELDRCSGTQFDPTVVTAFTTSVSRLVNQA